jgi:hypothetical protein
VEGELGSPGTVRRVLGLPSSTTPAFVPAQWTRRSASGNLHLGTFCTDTPGNGTLNEPPCNRVNIGVALNPGFRRCSGSGNGFHGAVGKTELAPETDCDVVGRELCWNVLVCAS